ncbi:MULTISPECIES: hypothetical protein [Streptomyces]|nr:MULTISPECIES: hypothetical protein [Streptomyces]
MNLPKAPVTRARGRAQDIIDSQPTYDNHYAESEAWAARPRSTEA